ncbi:60s acidic ribosomal protein P2 [Cerrena zonata]|uniref:60s acidic ribosomal protein P2 n=1 Tax=Cerrena zonata TaxID=2478898 RepID=A0AAW0G058_9APHY
MRYIAAYLLLQIGGNTSPSAADVKKVLSTVGIEADDDRLSSLLSELNGKDVNTLIAEGSAKLASVPSGGAVAASSGGAAGGAPAAAAEKEEEKKEEEKEESDDDMGFGLFD